MWRAGAPGNKEGVPSECSQARAWVPKRTERGFCTTLRGQQPGTGWEAKKDEEGILPESGGSSKGRLISITSDMQMNHPYDRKQRGTKEPLDESERGE